MDTPVANQIVAAAQHAGVAELCAEVIVPQIGVGVKMHNVQIRILAHRRTHCAQGDKVFPAQQQRQFAVAQNLRRTGFNIHECALRRTEAQLQVSAVKHIAVGQILVLIGAVRFQSIAFVPHGRGAKACAGAVAGGRVKRRTV